MAQFSGLNLAGHLLDLDDHELRRFQGRKAHQNVDNAPINVVLRRGFFIALDEVGLPGALPGKGSLSEKVMQKRADIDESGTTGAHRWVQRPPTGSPGTSFPPKRGPGGGPGCISTPRPAGHFPLRSWRPRQWDRLPVSAADN